MTRKDDKASLIFAALAILAWSTVSSAFKLALIDLSPLGLLLISSVVATLFLFAYNLCARKKLFEEFRQNTRSSLAAGLLNPFLYYLVLFSAYDRLPAQEAQALNYTWAIVLFIFSVIFFKERFRAKDLLALLISFLGILVISSRGKLTSFRFDDIGGISLALGSSFIWAGYWILNMKDKRDAGIKLFYNFMIGTSLIVLYALISGKALFSTGVIAFGTIAAIWVGIFEMGLTFLFWQKALEYSTNTARISNLVFITPFLSLVFIRIVLNEAILPSTLIGLFLIVFSNLIQRRKD
ncbi:MAG TPA: DMT family transporter [Candidatus Cloacimonetes bacterium]|nr:DMT family transporter [Candidatus Cloacimonadota bacterium]